MARDIEEFLRRAAERRKQQQQAKSAPPPASRPPVQQQPPLRQGQPAPQPERLVIEDDAIEIVELSRADMREQSVSDHVRSHIDTSDIAEHASHLGERISKADARVDRRVQRKFSRDLTSLDDTPSVQSKTTSATHDDPSQLVVELIEMFKKPKSLQQVILLNEILNRPDFDRF